MTAKACISPGICGLQTTVTVQSRGSRFAIAIDSGCCMVRSFAGELADVDPWSEVWIAGDPPRIWQLAAKHGLHAACPVPVGILKAIEVEAGLALPAHVSIEISRE